MATRLFMKDDKRRSTVTEAELEVTHFIYETPNDVYFYKTDDFERTYQSLEGMIVVHEATMDAGLRFPLYPAISHLLTVRVIAPA